ncbi:adenylate kinase family enzyme [Psychromicrobium silvestre]|uniref:Adenylate kinase family enzyme n=1 Tax=Psychromicrobium silvestre TaxID=1645614 RepID=A0A7Y9S3Y4_9MICC|nr:adenylate kinase [Psychromicrobium silvestre]NYE94128.1 adenylate kinase family enzyme [Psychromicrobium silvestre]
MASALPEPAPLNPSGPGLPGNAHRVLIYGVTGSGKSTLALRLSTLTGFEAHLVDEEIGWLPGWQGRPEAQMRELAAELAAGESWIFDSTYSKFRDLLLSRTELIIGLDYPRSLTLFRLIRRTVRRIVRREQVCNGNVETWAKVFSSDSILIWHFKSFTRKRRAMREFAAQAAMDHSAPRVLLFKHPDQTDRWLASLSDAVGS